MVAKAAAGRGVAEEVKDQVAAVVAGILVAAAAARVPGAAVIRAAAGVAKAPAVVEGVIPEVAGEAAEVLVAAAAPVVVAGAATPEGPVAVVGKAVVGKAVVAARVPAVARVVEVEGGVRVAATAGVQVVEAIGSLKRGHY